MRNVRYLSPVLAVALSLCLVVSGCTTSWITTAINDIPVVVQIVTSILQIVAAASGKGADPTMIAQVGNIGQQAQSDLQLLNSLVSQYQSASAAAKPGLLNQIDAALTTAQGNLNQILVAFHVNDPALQATIAGSVGLALSALLEIQSLIPPAPNAPATRMAISAKALKPRTAKQLKDEANFIFQSHGYSQYVIS